MKQKIFISSIITIIIVLGIFLRSYNFADWLHFELDQSRDAKLISSAIEGGIQNLPLLGPRAGGTFLRLGPAFYYLEYLSALAYGNTPAGIAFGILFFSILTLPLFYFFCREYFDQKISIILLLLFSTSLFLIVYSRFAWNPNFLPFFILASFYCLLKLSHPKTSRPGVWLLAFAAALAITTQFHFLAFIGIPAVVLVFLLIKRPKISWKYWLGALGIIIFFYSPLIINDYLTKGKNAGQFLEAVSGKSNKQQTSLIEKTLRNYTENSIGYFLLLTGQEKAQLPNLKIANLKNFDIVYKDNRNYLYLGLIALFFFSTGILLLVINFFKEKDAAKKNFLLLTGLWFGIIFGLYIPISASLSPRFFLLITALPFIFFGFILNFWLKITQGKKWENLGYLLVVLVLASNLYGIKTRATQLEKAPYQTFEIEADRILKERYRVTLKQQNQIMQYIENNYLQDKKPVFVDSKPFYRRSFLYHLDQQKIPRVSTPTENTIYREVNFYLIYPPESNTQAVLEKYQTGYTLVEEKSFGTLKVFFLQTKKDQANKDPKLVDPNEKKDDEESTPQRFDWESLFSGEEE